MAIGFGQSTTNKKSLIKSLSTSFIADPLYLSQMREDWDLEYSNRSYKCSSKEMLFTSGEYSYSGPEKTKDHFQLNKSSSTYRYRAHQSTHSVLTSGYWGLMITHDQRGRHCKNYQEWDFTFTVKCGPYYIFHPMSARKHIVYHHGFDTFNEWRQVVVDDLRKFAKVIEVFNPPAHIVSATCSPSSERVCKRLGLDVRRGFAYFLHRKGEPCLHANGEFNAALI